MGRFNRRYFRETTPAQVASDIGATSGNLGQKGLTNDQRSALRYYCRRYLNMSTTEVQGETAKLRYAYDSPEAIRFYAAYADNYSGKIAYPIDTTGYTTPTFSTPEVPSVDLKPSDTSDDDGLPDFAEPQPKKENDMPTPATPDQVQHAFDALKAVLGNSAQLDEGKVIELIKTHSPVKQIEVTVKRDDKTIKLDPAPRHMEFENVLKWLSAGCNVMMVGPAGSGKTTIANDCAKALDLPFYFNGALASEYKLSGFIDAQGRIISTPFRKAYENGGVYLFDEVDASLPQALLAFNAALANGHYDFPDGVIEKHNNFYCVAAANTFGQGADRIYVGRNQLDAASLDRFATINIDYDENLERLLANNSKWVDRVQRVRRAVNDLKLRHVVSPRASIFGAKALATGLSQYAVEKAWIWKGLDEPTINKIEAQVRH